MWALLVPGCGLPAPEASVARFGCLLGHNRVRQRSLIKSALGTIRAEGDPSGLRVIHSGNLRPRRRPAWVLNIRIGVQCVEGDTTHLLNVHEDCGCGAQPRFANGEPRRRHPCSPRELPGMASPFPASHVWPRTVKYQMFDPKVISKPMVVPCRCLHRLSDCEIKSQKPSFFQTL